MRGRFGVGVVMVLTALLLAGCQGTSDQTRFRESLPEFADVQFVRIELSHADFERRPLPLTPQDSGERIAWILDQLKTAPISALPVESAYRGFSHVGPVLQVVVHGGIGAVNIFPAIDCRTPTPGVYNCRYNPRDVVVLQDETFHRLVAPELTAWRAEGYLEETPIVSSREYEAFMERQFPDPYIPAGDPIRAWLNTVESARPLPLPLVAGTGSDDETLRKIAAWLRAATPGSPDTVPGDYMRWGDAARPLYMAFHDPVGVVVHPAYICLSDGWSLPCYRSPDEVIVDDIRGFRGSFHLRAPELAQWMETGWRADMRSGTYAEYRENARWDP